MIGQTISHYRIVEKLGEGGMGVVYRAEDTQLLRTVALKFLSSETVGNHEVKARLIREAQASASLDHPNICAVHGIHDEQGQTFIAMAFIDGPSLADKIKERPLPASEALRIAILIGAGLQEAHEKGIVHRDIKPQNVMLTSKGQVKITDFGLASLVGRSKITKSGATLGTPSYMSPEQLEGKQVDRRADIWALGVVLYEMLTQRTPFEAKHEQAIAYRVLNEEPEPVTAQRAGLPLEIDRIVGKALAKDRDQRYQNAADLLVDLRSLEKSVPERQPAAASAPVERTGSSAKDASAAWNRKYRILQILFAASVLIAVALALSHIGETPSRPSLRRFTVQTPEQQLPNSFYLSAAISPDGRYVVFAAAADGGKLWIQGLDELRPRAIEGTEGAEFPFWSPDSEFIGFFADRKLKRVPVRGGLAISLCDALGGPARGGSWSPDQRTIVFSTYGAPWLYQIPAAGGLASPLFKEQDQNQVRIHPQFLPSEAGERVLLYVGTAVGPGLRMIAQDLDSSRRTDLGPGLLPVYAPSGHILYQEDPEIPNLWALPFSLSRLQPVGDPFPVATNASGASVASDGTLVYVPSSRGRQKKAVWLERGERGKKVDTGLTAESIRSLALAPDGSRLAFDTVPRYGSRSLWVHDLARGTQTLISKTADTLDSPIVWSPDGQQVVFSTRRSGNWDVFTRQADGSGSETAILDSERNETVFDWSQDGKYLFYGTSRDDWSGGNASTGSTSEKDIWYLERNESGSGWKPEPIAFLRGHANESHPKISPDGRSIAYVSDESGRQEVYLQPFPGGGSRKTVSHKSGWGPRWRADGKELYYVDGSTLMAVAVSPDGGLTVGSATPVTQDIEDLFDVSSDGKKVLVLEPLSEGRQALLTIHLVEDWYEEFRPRAQD